MVIIIGCDWLCTASHYTIVYIILIAIRYILQKLCKGTEELCMENIKENGCCEIMTMYDYMLKHV